MDELNEAGTLDSGLAIKRLNDVRKFGKDVLRARSVEDKLDALARQNFAVGGLALMAIAVSGDKSFMLSTVYNAPLLEFTLHGQKLHCLDLFASSSAGIHHSGATDTFC